MYVKTYGAAIRGINATIVTVETATTPGAGLTIVGLPDASIRESAQRIQSAILYSNLDLPRKNIVVNLAPADIRKEGAAFDLALATTMLASDNKTMAEALANTMIMGELSLDGTVLPIQGALPMALAARQADIPRLILPAANAHEAAIAGGTPEVIGVDNLTQVLDILNGNIAPAPTVSDPHTLLSQTATTINPDDPDFADVRGQENVRRAIEVACAGGHNILMVGPPGAGKSMMAVRIPTILPPLTLDEALETTKIHSVAGKMPPSATLITARPFRSPHHTASPVALIGGGTNPMPGEISLAHNGVLFLDELPEYTRSCLEVLRQPLEDHVVTVSRARYSVDYPAAFMLVAAMNPCPCGYYTHPTRPCTCPPGAVNRYKNRISGPLYDRMDIQVFIRPVPVSQLADPGSPQSRPEDSATIRARVAAARAIQTERFRDNPAVHTNAQMTSAQIRRHCRLDQTTRQTLVAAIDRFQMSARAYDRILRVARTIADLDASPDIQVRHIAEAISYRAMDRATYGAALPTTNTPQHD